MSVPNLARPELREFAIHFLHCDWAALDVYQTTGVTPEISDDAVLGMNGNPIAITVLTRRGDDWPHRNFFYFADSLENIADLARFNFELMRVIDVLISAAAAAAEIRARRFNAMGRAVRKIDNPSFGELVLPAGDFRRGQLARQWCKERNWPCRFRARHFFRRRRRP